GADAPLVSVIDGMLRHRALLKSDVFDVSSLRFVRDHADLFKLPADRNSPIGVVAIRAVAAYVSLTSATDAAFTTASIAPDVAAVQRVLTNFPNASDADLAATLRTNETRISALKPNVLPLPADAFDALAVMKRCLTLSEQLGVSGETLALIA